MTETTTTEVTIAAEDEEEIDCPCHDCGAPATGTATCAHLCDCRGRVDLCASCGTSDLHVEDWSPDA